MTSSITSARLGVLGLPILLTVLLTSCKEIITIQKEADLKPVAAVVAAPIVTPGDYKITGTTSYTVNGKVTSSPTSGTLTVLTGNTKNTYYFLEKTASGQRNYYTQWTDSTFTVEAVYDNNNYQYVSYYGKQSGGGKAANGQIVLDRFVNTNTQVVTDATGERGTYSMPINKHVHLVACK